MTAIIRDRLQQGYRCLYLNSAPMVAGMRSCLSAIGSDVASEIAKARLVLSSEPVCPDNADFDIDLMLFKLEDSLNQALDDGYAGLWVSGDMTWEFGTKQDFSKLVEYEWRLEELFRKRKELHGICQYHRDTLPYDVMRKGLVSHNSIFINETLSLVNPHFAQSPLLAEQKVPGEELDKIIAALCNGGVMNY